MAVAAAVLLAASAAAAEVQTREIEYKEGEAVLKGLMAWDDASEQIGGRVLQSNIAELRPRAADRFSS